LERRGTRQVAEPDQRRESVKSNRRESQRQKLMVKQARVCSASWCSFLTALQKLMADENFMTLLRAEGLATMPKQLWDKVPTIQMERRRTGCSHTDGRGRGKGRSELEEYE